MGEGGALSVQELPVPQGGRGRSAHQGARGRRESGRLEGRARRVGQVPGTDVAGVIDTLGEGVTGWKVGDQVLGFARQSGSYAEYAVVPVSAWRASRSP